MSARVRTALVAVPLLLAVLGWGGPVGLGVVVAVVAAVGAAEYLAMVAPGANPLERGFVVGWAVVVVLSFLSRSPAGPVAALAVGTVLLGVGWMVGPGPRPDLPARWGAAVGAWVWVAAFLGASLWIRRWGVWPVLFVLAVVWAGDTAAYYVGTAFGSAPLAARVSPKKSVEGAVASLAGAALVAGAFGVLTPVPHGPWASLGLGVLLNAVAQVGDLCESLLKRCVGVKDSGTLFPGHGGVLDRVDAFLPVLPVYAALLGGCWG